MTDAQTEARAIAQTSLWIPAKPEHAKLGWSYDFEQTERIARAAYDSTGYDATMEVVEFVMAEADRRYAAALATERAALAKARRERDEARSIVRDIHWMAVRYADNRRSYAVGMCNDALRKAYDGGWLVYSDDKQHDLDPQYARDGMFDTEWRSAVDAANSRALEAEAQRDEALRAMEPFAWIGQWLFARDLPDETPVVMVEGAGKPFALTRGMFKAAHTAARRALTGGE